MERPLIHLELVENDNQADTKPNWKVFYGRWAMIPMIGMLFFIIVYQWAVQYGFDVFTSIILGSLFFDLGTLYVVLVVNNHPPSYSLDLCRLGRFKILSHLYFHGWRDHPPQIWRKGKTPPYPYEQ